MSRTISIFTILLGLTAILGSCSQQLDRRDALYSSDEIAMTGKVTKAFVEATTASLEADGFRTVSIIDEGNVFWFDETFKKDGDVYKAEGKHIYYPMEGTISLFSVYPPTQELTVSADAVSIQYVQDSDTDLLAARVLNVSHSKNALPMTFCHTLAQVKMQARCKENYTDIDVHMKEITVTGASSATYAYSDGGWTLSGETSGYSLFSGDKVIDSHETPTEVGEAMSFIPGTLSLNIKWECCQKGTTTKVSEYEADVEVTPAQALCSTYTLIVYDEGRKIRIGIDVTEWDTTDDPVEMKMEAAYTDLSKVNFLTGKAMPRSTANTYVVREDGTYRIPLVYGNGILKGEVNAVAYTRIEGNESLTHSFVNHLNTEITTPYIQDMIPESEVNFDNVKAILIWEELGNGHISNLSIVKDENDITGKGNFMRLLQFDVKDMPPKGGNAVVAVAVEDAKYGYRCIWSWQIWCSTDKFEKVNLENNNKQPDGKGLKFKLLNHYLGWVWDNDSKETGGTCVTYNWGRKDPIPINKSISKPPKEIENYYIYLFIRYPEWFGRFYVEDSTSYNNIWDASCNYQPDNTSRRTQAPTKTIYDPCPAGFKVPIGATFSGCHSNRDAGRINTGFSGNQVYAELKYDDDTKKYTYNPEVDAKLFFPDCYSRRANDGNKITDGCSLWVTETPQQKAILPKNGLVSIDNVTNPLSNILADGNGQSNAICPVEDDQLILEELN